MSFVLAAFNIKNFSTVEKLFVTPKLFSIQFLHITKTSKREFEQKIYRALNEIY